MYRLLIIVALAAATAACQTAQPHTRQTVWGLKTDDPKYASKACVDARAKAMNYDEKWGEHAAVGVAIGVGGVLAMPLAMEHGRKHDAARYAVNREVTRHCVTRGEAIVAASDAERAKEEAEYQSVRPNAPRSGQ